jgi:hypothetical protein
MDMKYAQLLINSALSGQGACYFNYYPSLNRVYLLNDAGTAWLGPVALGGPSLLSNSQCHLNAFFSSAAGGGNSLAVDLMMSFKSSFQGSKKVFLNTGDFGGLSTGWQQKGSWTVP